MKNLLILFILVVSICSLAQARKISMHQLLAQPYKDDRVVTWNFGSFIFPKNRSVEFDIKFFSPTQPGNYPVIVFFTGFDGLVPAFIYVDFCTKLSIESNSIIVSFDRLRPPSKPEEEELLFESTLNWTLANLGPFFNNKHTPDLIRGRVFPDYKGQGITLMGHSAAGHTLVSYLVKSCGQVKSLVLLDPVDGFDPFGLVDDFITHPPAQLNFTTPTLVVATGLDSDKLIPGMTPCAPANISNARFYDSLPGPTWFLNFTSYGHIGLLDDWGRKILNVCADCKANCDFPLYRSNLAKAIGVFINGVKERNKNLIRAIENPPESGLFDPTIKIDFKFKHNGYNVIQTGAFCKHT